jgi:hypothetical protein
MVCGLMVTPHGPLGLTHTHAYRHSASKLVPASFFIQVVNIGVVTPQPSPLLPCWRTILSPRWNRRKHLD